MQAILANMDRLINDFIFNPIDCSVAPKVGFKWRTISAEPHVRITRKNPSNPLH